METNKTRFSSWVSVSQCSVTECYDSLSRPVPGYGSEYCDRLSSRLAGDIFRGPHLSLIRFLNGFKEDVSQLVGANRQGTPVGRYLSCHFRENIPFGL